MYRHTHALVELVGEILARVPPSELAEAMGFGVLDRLRRLHARAEHETRFLRGPHEPPGLWAERVYGGGHTDGR